MAYRFDFTRRARDAVDRIVERMAERSPDRAERWSRGLFERIDALQTFPLRCPAAPETGPLGVPMRELLYGKRQNIYRVLFEVRGDLIVIHNVRHSAGRPEDP